MSKNEHPLTTRELTPPRERDAQSFAALESEASAAASPHPVGAAVLPCQSGWIEIELFHEDGRPAAGEAYRVLPPGRDPVEGTLDERGFARVEGLDSRSDVQVTFPSLDQDAWRPQ